MSTSSKTREMLVAMATVGSWLIALWLASRILIVALPAIMDVNHQQFSDLGASPTPVHLAEMTIQAALMVGGLFVGLIAMIKWIMAWIVNFGKVLTTYLTRPPGLVMTCCVLRIHLQGGAEVEACYRNSKEGMQSRQVLMSQLIEGLSNPIALPTRNGDILTFLPRAVSHWVSSEEKLWIPNEMAHCVDLSRRGPDERKRNFD